MAWPTGLPMGSVNFGTAVVMQSGVELPMRVTVDVVLASNAPSKTLVYRPTGSPLPAVSTVFDTEEGVGTHSLALPLCDSADMGYGNGQAIVLDETRTVTHIYKAKIEYLSPDKKTVYANLATTKNFVLTSDRPSGDLDDMALIPDSGISYGLPVLVPPGGGADLSGYTPTEGLAPVALSGSYNDLDDTPALVSFSSDPRANRVGFMGDSITQRGGNDNPPFILAKVQQPTATFALEVTYNGQTGTTTQLSINAGAYDAAAIQAALRALPFLSGAQVSVSGNNPVINFADNLYQRAQMRLVNVNITDAGPTSSAKPFLYRTFTTDCYTHVGLIPALSGRRVTYAGNWATGGYKVADALNILLPRLAATPLHLRPGNVIVLIGTNDVPSTPSADFHRDLNALYDGILALGVTPVACTIPPRGRESSPGNVPRGLAFNTIIRNVASQRGLALLDFHAAVVDPKTGYWRTGAETDGGGIHPLKTGYEAMARSATVQSWLSTLPEQRAPLAVGPQDPTDLLQGLGIFNVDSNADGISESWTRTGTAGVFSRYEADGVMWQRCTKASTDTGTATLVFTRDLALTANKTYAITGRFKITGMPAGETSDKHVVSFQFVDASKSSRQSEFTCAVNTEGHFYNELTVPPGGMSQVRVEMRTTNSTAGSTTFDLAQVAVFPVETALAV